jgi:hypothetical protein
MDPESLYRQLGQLVADAPQDLGGPTPPSEATLRWLGRASALISQISGAYDCAAFTTASDNLTGMLREMNAHQIMTILHRALARAELVAPVAVQGAFIPAGASFDVFQAIGKVLQDAQQDLLIADPYLDSRVLTDFLPLSAETVSCRLLSDMQSAKKDSLIPALSRWQQQYGATRPVELRLTQPRALHDRLIVVDGVKVWSLTQSIKDFAARSPASVLRTESELASMKVAAYEALWDSATRAG